MTQSNNSDHSSKKFPLGTTAQSTNGSPSFLSSLRTHFHDNEKSSFLDINQTRFQHAKTVAAVATHTSDRFWYAIMLQEASMARSDETGTFSFMDDVNERRLDAIASARLIKDSTRNARLALETVENVSTAFLNVGRYLAGHETKEFKKDETLTQKRIEQSLGQHMNKEDIAAYSERLGKKTVNLGPKQLEQRIKTFQEDSAALKRQINYLASPTSLSSREINRIRGFVSYDAALTDAQRKEIKSIVHKNSRISDQDKRTISDIVSKDRKLYPFEVDKLENILTKRVPLTQTDKEQMLELLSLKKERDKELRCLISFSKAKESARKDPNSAARIRNRRKIESTLSKVDKINKINESHLKAALKRGYDPTIDKKLVRTEQKILRERNRAVVLKNRILDDYSKGAKLSPLRRRDLLNCIREKKALDASLRLSVSQHRALLAKKNAQAALTPNCKIFTTAEKKQIAKLRENLRLHKAHEGIRNARRGRYQLKRSFISLVSSAARESEEAGIQGLLRANRMIQSRFARPVLVDAHKMLLSPAKMLTKPVRPVASLAAKSIDNKLQVSMKIKRLKADTKIRVKYSQRGLRLQELRQSAKKELNGGIYHRAKRRVLSATPEKVKVGAEKLSVKKKNAVHYISNKHRVFEKWRNKLAAKFKNSFVGRAWARANSALKKAREAATLSRLVLKRVLSITLLCALLVSIVGIILTSSSNLASSLVLTDNEKDGKLDISPYGEILNEAQKKWYEELDEFVANAKKTYYQVHVEYLSDAATNNFKEIISMAAVYFGQELDDTAALEDYLCHLYEISHYYETEEIHGISCPGCKTKTTQCTGCVKDDYGLTCPGHSETYCPGNHIRLNVELMVLGFDDIFWADDYAGGGATSSGGMYKGDLIGEKFLITGYCNCTTCCGQYAGGPTSSGVMPKANHTIAVDPDVIPIGTHVIINGKEYVAEDTGGAIKGNRIDMYFGSHQEALNWGKRYYDVYLATSDPGESSAARRAIDYSQYSLSELKVFLAAKNITVQTGSTQGADEFSRSVAALEKYDKDNVNESFTTAELNAFVYIDMSKNALRELCDKRSVSYSSSDDKYVLALLLIKYDLAHPKEDPLKNADEITVDSGEGSSGLLFDGWTDLNVEWAKNIYKHMTDEYYAGLDTLEGSYDNSEGFSGYEITEGSTAIMYYSQYDSRWKNSAYGSSTIGKSGCGPTSMAMVISSLTNTTVDPVQMCNWASSKGYYISGVGTSWSFISGSASNWGLSCQQVSKSDVQAVINALSSGKLVVMSTGPGTYYTGKGHFLVLRGVTADGKILVADPASEEKTQKAWAVSDITSGLKAWWIIGK